MIDGPHKAWPQKDELLIERIDGLLSAAPVRRKNFFGTVAWFLSPEEEAVNPDRKKPGSAPKSTQP